MSLQPKAVEIKRELLAEKLVRLYRIETDHNIRYRALKVHICNIRKHYGLDTQQLYNLHNVGYGLTDEAKSIVLTKDIEDSRMKYKGVAA